MKHTVKQEREFLLAVRRIEQQHGMYLRSSDCMEIVEQEPSPDVSVFSAHGLREHWFELQRQWEAENGR